MLKYTCTGFSLFPSSVPLDVVCVECGLREVLVARMLQLFCSLCLTHEIGTEVV